MEPQRMPSDSTRLKAIQEEMNQFLEERITELMARVRAAQDVTSQLASTEQDIRRQDAQRMQLEAELTTMNQKSKGLGKDNAEIEAKVAKMRENVERMKNMREEMMSNLSGLTSELKSLAPGSD